MHSRLALPIYANLIKNFVPEAEDMNACMRTDK